MVPGIFIILLFYAAGEFIGTLTAGSYRAASSA